MTEAECKGTLRAFVRCNDQEDCDADAVFAQEQLAAVKAIDVVECFNCKAHGTPTPSAADRPIHARSNTLCCWKKALSFFFPNRNHQWNELTETGNPAKSQILNDMTKKVKKFETRGQGAQSKARRAVDAAEFKSVVNELKSSNTDDIVTKCAAPALMCFQFHMIGRVDDCCKWKRTNFRVHDVHPHKAAKARLAWSKNVGEERDAPWQHVFGCMDPLFCVLLNIAMWLELFHAAVLEARNRMFLFGFTQEFQEPLGQLSPEERNAKAVKNKVCELIKPVLSRIGVDVDGLLGSHSVRKFGSAWCRNNGASKDDKDHRGRWKSCSRVSDACDEIQLDWVDAKAAQLLCPGGACECEAVDPACAPQWFAERVCPNVNQVFGVNVAFLLGRSLLWCAFSAQSSMMPTSMRDRIKAECEAARSAQCASPIRKRLATVTGHDGVACVEQAEAEEQPQDPTPQQDQGEQAVQVQQAQVVTPNRDNVRGTSNRQLLLSVMSTLNALRRTVTDQSNQLDGMRGDMRRLERTNAALNRKIDSNPLHQLQQAAARRGTLPVPGSPRRQVDTTADPTAVLMPHPRDLHQLWRECTHGCGRNKPARCFTRAERGRNKSACSRRKAIWDIAEKQVRAGHSAAEAVSNICNHFGQNKSPTAVVSAMRRAKDANALPLSLR